MNGDDIKNWCDLVLLDVGYDMFGDDEIVKFLSTILTETNEEEDGKPTKPAISRKETIQ